MDETTKPGAPESAPAQSEAKPAPAPESSKREKQLEADLKKVTKERDGYKNDLEVSTERLAQLGADRDKYAKAYESAEADVNRYKHALELLDEAERQKTAMAQANRESEVKELLKRNGLPKAWVMADGSPCFDENHAKHMAGADFDSLTTISAE